MTIEDTRRHTLADEDTHLDRDQVLRRVELIAGEAHDDMSAAGLERELRLDFIKALAAGTLDGDPAMIARDLLATENIEFYRW